MHLVVVLVLLNLQWALGQNTTDLPTCVTGCLGHAMSSAEGCDSSDAKCLCSSSDYIDTFACCLATACSYDDQQTAIAYNVAYCDTVNETAPNFVGCSSDNVTTSITFDTSTLSSVASSMFSIMSSMSMSTTSMVMSMGGNGNLLTTVSGSVSPLSTLLTGSTTAKFAAKSSLLTGTCTVPFFAEVTDNDGFVTEYPEVGCASGREDCCPFDNGENGVLTKCPADYFTTAGACCPSGWQIYFTAIGSQTPCYTMPAVTHLPASSPTQSDVTVITEHVFTRRYELVKVHHDSSLSGGAEAGIAIGIVVLFIAILVGAALLWLRKKKARRQGETTLPSTQEQGSTQRPPEMVHELPSPGAGTYPGTGHALPLSSHLINNYPEKPSQPPSELPGSYHIHQHHPVFSFVEGDDKEGGYQASSPEKPLPASPTVISPLDSKNNA